MAGPGRGPTSPGLIGARLSWAGQARFSYKNCHFVKKGWPGQAAGLGPTDLARGKASLHPEMKIGSCDVQT